ncbi:MAG TPA: thiopeptide-type bacteriocin biosynthesis protein, partial [Caulobacteraceae bacterium]|nr:thiopeptide-type bacteriocin biosynthesis protein [Caulobacteraceae bacterium]
CRLNPVPERPPWYQQVKAKFINRYGLERDVPVDLIVRQNANLDFVPINDMAFTRREIAVLKLAAEALAAGRPVLELDEALVETLAAAVEGTPSVPTSCEIAVTVCAKSAADVDRGDFRLMLSPLVGTRQAGRLSGRFLTLLDGEASPRMRAICRAEEAALAGRGRIRAEVFYTPKRVKLQNVTGAPAGWSHAIVLNASPDAPGTRIDLADLRVGVRDGELAIIWARTGQVVEVSPLQMLNSVEGARVVRFLTEVGGQQSSAIAGFDWGLADTFPRLPRVVFDNWILRPAQWRLARSPEPTRQAFAAWRETFGVPDEVYLVAKDNRLWLDFADPEHVDDLVAEWAALEGTASLCLQEALPGPGDAWVEGPGGPRLAEITVPLVSASLAAEAGPPPRPLADYDDRERNKSLASGWIYANLYADWHLHDGIIAGRIAELMASLGEGRRFFFIRYSDPLPHVRLRLALGDEAADGPAAQVAAWADGLVREGVCSDVAFLRYERELERYGGVEGMRLAEEIFAADSRLCQALIAARTSGRNRLAPRTLCVVSLDRLLRTFGMDERAIAGVFPETAAQKLVFGPEFRRLKDDLRALLSRGDDAGPADGPVSEAYRAMGEAWQGLARLAAEGRLGVDLDQVRSAFAHLHVNRQLGVDPEAEAAVFALLARARTSLLAHPRAQG